MSEEQAIQLNKKYAPLFTAKTRYFYVYGGRGSGKSFAVGEFIHRLTFEKGHVILYTRYTMTAASKSIIPEFVQKMELSGTRHLFNVTQDQIINKQTGSKIIFSGIKTSSGNQTAALKSLQGVTTWVYDEFEEHPDEESFDVIDLSVRQQGMQNRIILMSNALHKESWQYQRFFKEAQDVTTIYTTYLDNQQNLEKSFINRAEFVKSTNLKRYNKDFLGQHYMDLDDALWNMDMIQRGSKDAYDRIVVAIDPAISSKKESDDTGIVVCAKRGDGGYVLEDKTGKYTPDQWAKIAVQLYEKYHADRIVAEINQGGDLVENVIRQVDKTVSFKQVRATKGKVVRAEPILALYEQGLIYHVKPFTKLELEMTTWQPSVDDYSPNRVDALVWGMTELFMKNKSGWVL